MDCDAPSSLSLHDTDTAESTVSSTAVTSNNMDASTAPSGGAVLEGLTMPVASTEPTKAGAETTNAQSASSEGSDDESKSVFDISEADNPIHYWS